jgi:hypothetical protein
MANLIHSKKEKNCCVSVMAWFPLLTDNESRERFASYQKDDFMRYRESEDSESTSTSGSLALKRHLINSSLVCIVEKKINFGLMTNFPV